jgi:hypothetical protein
MIGIVIPLKAKRMSADWRATGAFLRQTLASISRQSCQALRVLIVCHELPDVEPKQVRWKLPPVEIMEAPFSPPSERVAFQMRRDKERKVTIGTKRLLCDGCDWIMKLDADDLISRETCKYIENSRSDAVIFRKGIIGSSGSRWHLLESRNFHRVCGSCFAFRRHLILDVFATEATRPLSQFFVSDHHEEVIERCLEHSVTMSCPPFAAACYVQYPDVRLSTIYHPDYKPTLRGLIGRLRRLRRTTPAVREEFSMGFN